MLSNIIYLIISALAVAIYMITVPILVWGIVPLIFKIILDLICVGYIPGLFNINLLLGFQGYFLLLLISQEASEILTDVVTRYTYYFILYIFGKNSIKMVTGGETLEEFRKCLEEQVKKK